MQIADNRVRLEWLILCDSAEIAGNKLYMLGGGWDVLTVNDLPATHHLAIAVSFKVPWGATNQKHDVTLALVNEDTSETLMNLSGQFETGRPPGIPPGSTQRAQLAFGLGMRFETTGLFIIRCTIDSQEQVEDQVPFRVVAGPLLAAKQRPPSS